MTHNPSSFEDVDAAREQRAQEALWNAVALLWHRRRFIIGTTSLVGVLAVVITLLMPNWYKASTRLLPADGGGGSGISALLDEFAPGANAILGGGSEDTDRLFTLLNSRRVLDAVIDTFDLETVYETAGKDYARDRTIKLLKEYATFALDDEFGFMSITVADTDPERAAAMANFFVVMLNRVNIAVNAENASSYRAFMEQNLRETETALNAARASLQAFQEETGLLDVTTQLPTYLEAVVGLRTAAIEAEIRYNALRMQFGAQNPQANAARIAARSANDAYEAALRGRERFMQVEQDSIPEAGRRYSELYQEILIQAEILKFVRPLYEQARFDEQREKASVQVIDEAIPPERKSHPKRSIICIVATLSAGILSMAYVLLADLWRRQAPLIAARLNQPGA